MSVRLYVGNLPKELERQELAAVFAEAGDSVSTKVITDRKTGKCRGFGFVTVKTDEEADQIIEKFNGYSFKDAVLKIEKALPRSKGKGEDDGMFDAEQDDASPVVQVGGEQPSNGSASGGKSRRSKGNNKSRRSSTGATTDVVDSIQPDPRWAQELEKLKQLLAAQATAP